MARGCPDNRHPSGTAHAACARQPVCRSARGPDWTLGVGVRYSGRQYGTLDNADVPPDVYSGTSRFLTVDLKAGYRIDRHVTLALGVDHLTDRRYFVHHPYPSRTFYGQLKWRL
ncbi:hypothetical protein RSP795_18395 [Ralstonia solanacearum]|nr:hypothetical protein RSP795_18395 [Ralstonia solanacearum]OAI61027.1 hypothetical protein RSP597_22775 [Ralstonia solanacearum]